MCGILGIFGHPDHMNKAARALEILEPRGRDAQNIIEINQGSLGHTLHAIVGNLEQPLTGKGTLVANCEIYNWQELGEGENDAQVLLNLLDESDLSESSVKQILDKLDGVYAFIYVREDIIIFARDLIGVKPLWYSPQEGIALASEKKALTHVGYDVITDLNPRMIGHYHLEKNILGFWKRDFYQKGETDLSEEEISEKIKDLFMNAVKKRLPSKHIKVGVLFSGGIDSTLIAKTLQDMHIDFTCYTSHVNNPQGDKAHDLVASQRVAQKYGFPLTIIDVTEDQIPTLAKTVTQEIEEAHAVKVGVGMPFYGCAQAAAQDGCKVIFSGLGAEELFAGYKRHKDSKDINDECINGLLWMYERDLYRDDVLTMRQGVELRLPMLDRKLIEFALSIPSELKIRQGVEKFILRKAALKLGLEEVDAMRPKKAAQYGSKFDNALEKVARKEGKNRVEYLKQFTQGANRKIGVMCSGGKDSWYAAHIMQQQNYDLSCLLVMKSHNQDSYMFHTPAIDLVQLQAKAANIPLLEQETAGEKELELEDLKELFIKAKKEFHIDGVVTGALYSQYQRKRIEQVCDDIGLKVYTPLWHIGQASELWELLLNDFVITFSSVAGEGMSAKWLGREIDEIAYKELVELETKIGFNVAGEGGEYESLVLDCPLFEKRLVVKGEAVMENQITGRLNIISAKLAEK